MASLVAETAAPGTTAPLVSRTDPVISEVDICASAAAQTITNNERTIETRRIAHPDLPKFYPFPALDARTGRAVVHIGEGQRHSGRPMTALQSENSIWWGGRTSGFSRLSNNSAWLRPVGSFSEKICNRQGRRKRKPRKLQEAESWTEYYSGRSVLPRCARMADTSR